MPRRIIVFCVFATAAAIVFIRLGIWQITRLHERQAFNAMVLAQKTASSTPFFALPRDTASAHYRAASVAGKFDYAHELIISPRTRHGSPGVDLLTPMRIAGNDTAILVNRGWVYSPDATGVDQKRWLEADSTTVTGFADLFSVDTMITHASNPRVIRRVSYRDVASKLPYPVAPFYLVATYDTANLAHPARRELPELEDGPHRGYAIQWFSFAAISIVGAVIVARGVSVPART